MLWDWRKIILFFENIFSKKKIDEEVFLTANNYAKELLSIEVCK